LELIALASFFYLTSKNIFFMYSVLYRMASISTASLHFVYKSLPWFIQVTNGDSGYMIGAVIGAMLSFVKPLIKKTSEQLKLQKSAFCSGFVDRNDVNDTFSPSPQIS
jgi:hypothetical protein